MREGGALPPERVDGGMIDGSHWLQIVNVLFSSWYSERVSIFARMDHNTFLAGVSVV
jgi:hypothetical protein